MQDYLAHPLLSVREKLSRADHHIGALDQAAITFLELKPYTFRLDTYGELKGTALSPRSDLAARGIDPAAEGFVIRPDDMVEVPVSIYKDIAVTLKNTGLSHAPHFGTIIGDIVHNLRSCLDHLAWQLAILARGGVVPKPTPIQWENLYWPICEKGSQWTAQKAFLQSAHINIVDTKVLTLIEMAQPFKRGKQAKFHALYVLNKLWNLDKHRAIFVVHDRWRCRNVTAELLKPIAGVTECRTDMLYLRPNRPLKREAVVARFRLTSPFALALTASAELPMNVQPQLVFDIAFDKASPGRRRNAKQVVRWLRHEVGKIVDEAAPLFPARWPR